MVQLVGWGGDRRRTFVYINSDYPVSAPSRLVLVGSVLGLLLSSSSLLAPVEFSWTEKGEKW